MIYIFVSVHSLHMAGYANLLLYTVYGDAAGVRVRRGRRLKRPHLVQSSDTYSYLPSVA